MNTMEAIARILKEEGVEWIACFPSNELIEEVAKVGIRTIMFRQERGALMAADGYSRLNDRNKFGVVITQGGPGTENSMGGLAQAFADNIPMLYLPGGSTVAQMQVRPNFSPARTYEAVSKYSEVILQPDMVSKHNAPRIPPPPQRSWRPRRSRASRRCRHYGSLRVRYELPAPQAPPAAALRRRHQGRRQGAPCRPQADDLVRHGRPARQRHR